MFLTFSKYLFQRFCSYDSGRNYAVRDSIYAENQEPSWIHEKISGLFDMVSER